MAWIYHQSTGELWHDGKLMGKGYSGSLTNKNNPDRQHVKGMGPMAITLIQTSGESFGRSLFRIHGEKKPPKVPGFASEGCIIVGPVVRGKVIHSSDNKLEVVR